MTSALVPDAMFPVQLKQAVLSIQRLLTLGYEPNNIHLVGDSAGGALIHQVLSHILHPVEDVPKLTLTSPLGGVYMMSPWTRLVHGKGSRLHINDGRGDVIVSSTGTYWGSKVLDGAKPSAIPYLDAASAPKDWLQGVDKYVKRILISAGDLEILRDAIVDYGKHIGEHLKDTTIIVQENGIHDDPFLDFVVGEKKLGSLTPKILDWLEEGLAR
jgi:acetyl esterase/lipase